MKALYRRAQANIQLADLDLAELDIKKALEIDPDNRCVHQKFFTALGLCNIFPSSTCFILCHSRVFVYQGGQAGV